MLYKTGVFVLLLFYVDAAYEGDACVKNGVAGQCVIIKKCQAAIDDIKRRISPQICGFSGTDPIVCCVDSRATATTSPRPVLTTTTRRTKTTTEAFPDYAEDGCPPLAADLISPKTGQKAFDKCLEYQERLVYPCVRSVAFGGGMVRATRCGHNADELIIGGVDAAKQEFPHMVLLGYGDTPETAQWLCGGSIISERFILTAGHCTSARDIGPISFVRVGALRRSDKLDLSRVYRVKRIVKHPDYKSPSKYNDITLLETQPEMKLDQYSVPACLHVGDRVRDELAAATGWGLTTNRGSNADTLQKVILAKFTREECDESFPANRNMVRGYDAGTQICYGDKDKSKDTCQGDSGGPLQIKSKRVNCMYVIVGVTSFGKACGFVGEPGMYSRVAPYVPWIESVVWP